MYSTIKMDVAHYNSGRAIRVAYLCTFLGICAYSFVNRDTFYSLGMILTEEKSTPSSELSELTETPNFWFIFNNI